MPLEAYGASVAHRRSRHRGPQQRSRNGAVVAARIRNSCCAKPLRTPQWQPWRRVPMFWRERSKRKHWAMQSLLQRLAAVDEGGPLHHAHHDSPRQVRTGRKPHAPFFFAGLACAALAGVLALAIISFVNGSTLEERSPYALTTTANNPSVEPPIEGRLLWWSFPYRATPTKKRRGSSRK